MNETRTAKRRERSSNSQDAEENNTTTGTGSAEGFYNLHRRPSPNAANSAAPPVQHAAKRGEKDQQPAAERFGQRDRHLIGPAACAAAKAHYHHHPIGRSDLEQQ